MAFAERVLAFTFSGSTNGSFTASGLRARVAIAATDGQLGVTGFATIWGLSPEQMNNYSTSIPSAIQEQIPGANLIIEASDLGEQPVQAINSPIWSSQIDLSGFPESAFLVSVTSISDAATPIAGQSQPGAQKAEDLIKAVCAGVTPPLMFVNNGASSILTNPNVYGSALDQIGRIARAAGFRYSLAGNTVSIWPQDGAVDDTVIELGPGTDPPMVGYPVFWQLGIIVVSLFNPQIRVGRKMNIVGSVLAKANGLWSIVRVEHDLTTMMSKGPWFTIATLAGPGGAT